MFIIIGLYCFIFGFGLFESYRRLKSEGVVVKDLYTIRGIAYSLLFISIVLLSSGIFMYK